MLVCATMHSTFRGERGKAHLCGGSRQPPPSSSPASISLSRPRLLLPFPVARNSISLSLPLPSHFNQDASMRGCILGWLYPNTPSPTRQPVDFSTSNRRSSSSDNGRATLRSTPRRRRRCASTRLLGAHFFPGWLDPLGELMVRERSLILHTRNAGGVERDSERAKQSKAAEQLKRRRV